MLKRKRHGAVAGPDGASAPLHWAGLIGISAILAYLFEVAALPAAFLLGPMMAGIGFGISGAKIRVPPAGFQLAQSVVGCLIASSITAAILASVLRDWPAMLLVVATIVLSSGLIGLLLGRSGALPGPVAAWGVAPGGAAAMVALSDASGADARLVATMQYVRVVCVVVTASVISKYLLSGQAPDAPPLAAPLTPPLSDAAAIAATVAIAAATSWLGASLRIPAGGLILPMVIGAALQAAGLVRIVVPEALLVVAYAAIGWTVGLRFTRDTLRVAGRAMPQILGASLAVIAFGALSAWLLTALRHTDVLTAFLATTPGGIDSVVIIAVGAKVDLPFVMALQALRVFVVVLTCGPLARAITRWSPP